MSTDTIGLLFDFVMSWARLPSPEGHCCEAESSLLSHSLVCNGGRENQQED